MTKVTVLRGYSASGKSTWARAQDAVVVSRDAIRQSFPGGSGKRVLDFMDEQAVTEIELATITAAVKRGHDVIVDNTNLTASYARRYVNHAVKLGADWGVKDFRTPYGLCIERNWARADAVPTHVIEDQARRFPFRNWIVIEPSTPKVEFDFPVYVPDTTKLQAFGFDLDGTLAHIVEGGRSPYDPTRYHEDVVDHALREILWALYGNFSIVILTGRSEDYREVVEKWLDDNGILYDGLFMRPSGDDRNDAIVKSEMFDKYVAPTYNLLMHFDDRNRVVAGLRSKGIKVAQVQEGDF